MWQLLFTVEPNRFVPPQTKTTICPQHSQGRHTSMTVYQTPGLPEKVARARLPEQADPRPQCAVDRMGGAPRWQKCSPPRHRGPSKVQVTSLVHSFCKRLRDLVGKLAW